MKIILIIGAIQGLIFSRFIFSVEKNRHANYFLSAAGVFCAIQIGLFITSYELPLAALKYNLKLFSLFTIFPIPVFFYFYIRFLVKGKKFYRIDIVHLLPTLLAILSVLPLFFLPVDQKIQHLGESEQAFIQRELFHMFGTALVVIAYGFAGYRLLKNYRMGLRDFFSNVDDTEMIWLSMLMRHLIIIGKVTLICCLYGISHNNVGQLDLLMLWNAKYIVYLVTSITLFWGSYNAIFHPELFREFEVNQIEFKKKYSHSILSDENQRELGAKMKELMETKKLYLNPNLKLGEVADEMGVSSQILSQLLNQYFDKNFYNFINEYRIEDAKTKLTDPNYAHYSIIGIADESGFKSKSTFYSLFKNSTGLTPYKFQKQSLE